MPEDDEEFQLFPVFNDLHSESLDDYIFEVEALVARSKDDEKKLFGPRLVRRLGGVFGALARRVLHMSDLTKPEGFKNDHNFLWGKKKKTLEGCSGQATPRELPVWGHLSPSGTDFARYLRWSERGTLRCKVALELTSICLGANAA